MDDSLWCIVGVTRKQCPSVWGPFATYEVAMDAMEKLTGTKEERVTDGGTVYHLTSIYATVPDV